MHASMKFMFHSFVSIADRGIDRAKAAMEALGITPKVVPIRGGTDGARLSFVGLPCPNLCTGGENFHGPYEYIPVEDMEKIVELLVQICKTF